MRLLVENLTSDATTPEHLLEILHAGHLANVSVCLDLGHAHMTGGVAEAIAILGARIASVHVHDNHGMKDEHLWPGEGTINWPAASEALKALAEPPAMVLEISRTADTDPATLPARIQQGFQCLE